MYWYYYRASCGIKAWYKEYITIMQIAQFIVDLVAIYFVSYNLFANAYFPTGNIGTSCAANLKEWTADLSAIEVPRSEIAALVGMICLTSYLFLFVAFYFATYKGGKNARTARTARSDLKIKSEAFVKALPTVMITSN